MILKQRYECYAVQQREYGALRAKSAYIAAACYRGADVACVREVVQARGRGECGRRVRARSSARVCAVQCVCGAHWSNTLPTG